MNMMTLTPSFGRKKLLLLSGIVAGLAFPAAPVMAQGTQATRPALIITSQPVPESLKRQLESGAALTPAYTPPARQIQSYEPVAYSREYPQRATNVEAPPPSLYTKPVEVREIQTRDIIYDSYYDGQETLVTKKIRQIDSDVSQIRDKVENLAQKLTNLHNANEEKAGEYFAAVATVNTQLQSGTTPGNPRLVSKLNTAEQSLEDLSSSIDDFNGVAVDSSKVASEAQFLLEEARAAYNIAGAVEEDHVKLAQTEDMINNTVVMIERVLNTVNDDLTRTSAYVSAERDNLRTLSLAVTNGDLYGKNLANRPFSRAGRFAGTSQAVAPPSQGLSVQKKSDFMSSESLMDGGVDSIDAEPAPNSPAAYSGVSGMVAPRMLVKIRFDNSDVDYEQPLYVAVNEALKRHPDAMFDLVAVHPSSGNAAKVAIESTRARRNAEKVLRTLTQMGLASDQVELSYDQDEAVDANEVRLYMR